MVAAKSDANPPSMDRQRHNLQTYHGSRVKRLCILNRYLRYPAPFGLYGIGQFASLFYDLQILPDSRVPIEDCERLTLAYARCCQFIGYHAKMSRPSAPLTAVNNHRETDAGRWQ